jgi:hypothetical protein
MKNELKNSRSKNGAASSSSEYKLYRKQIKLVFKTGASAPEFVEGNGHAGSLFKFKSFRRPGLLWAFGASSS